MPLPGRYGPPPVPPPEPGPSPAPSPSPSPVPCPVPVPPPAPDPRLSSITGGGPYRPGSGITPPAILHEVKPDYTEDGRRRNVEGDVVLEIVVRSDGTVGSNVKLLQGLGAGLDQRAVEAVRQWRFSPARRYGTPVDVIVEVAMEFKLR
jgi:TonB family protein